jgi:O-antigen ligase
VYFAPLAVAVLAFFLLRPVRRGASSVVVGLAFALVVAPMIFLSASSGAIGATAQAVADRLSSSTSTKLTTEGSYKDRSEETRDALRTLERDPVLGVGIGASLGVRRPQYDFELGRTVYVDRPFVHNSLLLAWLRLGLLGVLALILLGGRLVRVVRSSGRGDPRVLASALAVAAMAVSAQLQPYLVHRPAIIAVCFALALAAPCEREEEQ